MMLTEILPLKKQGYCCSQILMLLLLNARNEKNAGLIKSLNGLCCGISWSGEVCGILSGGAAVLSYMTGKGEVEEEAHISSISIVRDYVQWFKHEAGARYQGAHCPDIIGDSSAPSMEICGTLLSKAWEKILDLFERYQIDPLGPR